MAEVVATSAAETLVSKLVECLFAPIGRQFGYVLCYKTYVEDLENGVKELENARERVQRSVDEALNDGKLIYTDVEKWLKSVKEETDEVDNLLRRGEIAKDACFRGWLPNPVVRHPIGRKVKKMTPVIQKLSAESRGGNFQKVYYEKSPMGIVTATTSAASSVDKKEDVLESRASIAEDIMKAIADDKDRVIGVYGPGGVGKSKLLEDVKRRVEQEMLFDEIAVANVSRNPGLKRIQGEIAYALGLKLMNEETARGRADRLCKRLESDPKKKILIILDNLWKKLELKEVGIPCGDDNKVRGCKLLLTSRNRDVLRNDMSTDREFRLDKLEHDEARRLFERIAGDRANDPDIKPLVDGVVNNCGGLPLLIISTAKRLKHGDMAEWRNASTNINLSDANSIVELNYNDLGDDRVRSLFLVSAMYSRAAVMRCSLGYCIGLGLYKKFKTIEDARDMLIMDLHRLQDSSLLLDSDDMEEIHMHDLFADVAISIASAQWNALVGKEDYGFKEWSKDELRKCTAMSFVFVGINELPEKLDCPNLRMLILAENNPSLKISESFFESTEKLKVLDLTCLSFTSLPSSVEFLENLKSLYLDYCHLEDVTILGKLKGLQFLSFHKSTIDRLPKEIGGLTELRFLDLTGCTRLKIIEPGVLGSLVNLEELYMEDSFDRWEAEDEASRSNASLAELKNMKKLITLYIVIPHSANLPRDLPFGKLNRYKIQIGDVWDWSGEHKESKTLTLKLDLSNLLHEEWVSKCLLKTQDLHLDGLQDGEDSIHDLCVQGFPELKHLRVQNNATFKYVVDSTPAFMKLRSLFLKNLNKLEKICRGVFAPESFSKLKIVKVENCGKIKDSFPSSMMRIFLQLEEIEISKCHSMQQIVAHAEADEDGDEIDDESSVKSCELHRLTLQNLPKVTSFCKTMDHGVAFFNERQVSLPKLESLTMSELPKLKEIWNSQFPSDVSNLKFLEVEDCAFLLSIIPSNFLLKLQNLEALTVERCELIREIFDLERLTNSGDAEVLPRLTKLTLTDLPMLGNIWNKNPSGALCFQKLTALKVRNCEKLTFLFSTSMAKALVQIKEIEIASCTLMEEIMDVQEEESEEVVTTSTLEFPLLTSLSLKKLPNLRTFSYGKNCIRCPSLIRLTIFGCPKMTAFSSIERKQQSINANLQSSTSYTPDGSHPLFDEKSAFPKLEELHINGVQQEELWNDKILKESFCRLKVLKVKQCPNLMNVIPPFMRKRLLHCVESLTVEKCPRLRHLFTMSMAKSLGQLQYLGLGGCGEMEYIVAREEEKAEVADKIVIPQLVTLYLHNMPKLKSFCQGKHISKWPSLKKITVEDCKAVEVILGDSSCAKLEDNVPTQRPLLLVEKVEFPSLESMKISHMDNLEKIWLGELASNAFTKLKTLVVEYCEKLSTIFSSLNILTRFQNLEKITVTDCGSLEMIFHVKEFNLSEAHFTSTFELKELVLRRLPKMKHMWSGKPQGVLTFGHLRCMEIVECESLKSLFPSPVAKSMTQLEKLVVWDCGVEEIIAEEDGGVGTNADHLFFPRLIDLRLVELPKVRSFYRNSHISTWPLLTQLRVRHCCKMRPFSFACEFQSCQGTTTCENQPALFSFEKVIPQLEGSTLRREDVAMLQQQQHYTFAKLRDLGLSCYHDENDAFPSDFLLQRFPDLDILTVVCSSFEEIFPECASGYVGASVKALGNLTVLQLYKLCNLRRVWKDGSLMAEILKLIKCLHVRECQSLSIVLPFPTSFQRLTHLDVMDCDGLVHIGTCSAVRSLVHLTLLTLSNCRALEDVVTDDGDAEEISFPKLELLKLNVLPSLESFSPANCVFKFPSLVRVVITQCPKMHIFCKGALRTPKLDKVLLSDGDNEGCWECDLNTTIETLSA